MKQFITLGIILLFVIPVSGQVNIFTDFSGVFPPPGWSLTPEANWSRCNTREASGIRPECRLHYDPDFYDTARLISSTLDLTGIDSIHVIFLYSMASKGRGCTVGVASRSNGGNWHDVWHHEYDTYYNADPEYMQLLIRNQDVGKPAFQVCIYFSPGTGS
jgi:hypothetical protein